MKRSPILPVGAAVAAVALSASPGLAAAKPVDKRDQNGAVSFPLLALSTGDHAAKPSGHVSHSSPASHSSHYSSSHNSHASHASHFSSVPSSPPPSPTPTATATPTPTPTRHHHRRTAKAGRRHHHPAAPKSKSPSPSPSDITASPTTTINPRTVSHSSGTNAAGDVVIVLVIGGVTLAVIYGRKKRPR
jgi:hypothetical protein